MPSRARLLALLRSQGLGVICGQTSVLLLAIGSVVIATHRQDLYADLRLDDLRFFFEQPSPWHFWLYGLVVVMGVFALNTVLCTWQSLATRIRMRIRAPSAYAPALMHLSFLAALLAHLFGGLWGQSLPPRVVGPEWSALPWEARARTRSLGLEQHPDGSFAGVQVELEVEYAGARRLATLGFNQPITLDLGQKVLLIGGFQERPVAVRVTAPGISCELISGGEGCEVGAQRVRLLGIERTRGVGEVARFEVRDARGVRTGTFGAWSGLSHALPDGTLLRLVAIESRAFVQVSGREMPGNPWAMLATLLLGIGVLFHGRRWLV